MTGARRFDAAALADFAAGALRAMGCADGTAREVADHLIESDLCGAPSHGVFRLTQYAEMAREGLYDPAGTPVETTAEGGGPAVDGRRGFGIPALRAAVDAAVSRARGADGAGAAGAGVFNVFHTGRIGAFAGRAAEAGCLAVILGGGAHADWPQTAPYGGAGAVLPTNPYALAAPGGPDGPVTADFATSAGAGGKVYRAKTAGEALPEGLLLNAEGAPTTDPEDYFRGGALAPMAGPKGWGLGLVAELAGLAVDARPALWGLNWFVLCLDLARFRNVEDHARAAEALLGVCRARPPAPGFTGVEIPGQRERETAAAARRKGVLLPAAVIEDLRKTAAELGADDGALD